jgi:hypothetical protein
MTRTKSSQLVSAGAFSPLIALLSGCAGFDRFFNPNFLNTEQPFGQTSLNTVKGSGPVTIVVENLTTEARHQENAQITINYIDEQLNTQMFTTQPLNAVPEANRDPNKPNYDSSYRQIIVLNCGIQEVWFNGIVYRTRIDSQTQTIVLGNQQSTDITYSAAAITRFPADVSLPATSMTTILPFDAYIAPQFLPSHLLQTKHFQCGDVILVGVLDQRTQNSQIFLQQYTTQYTDLNSLSKAFPTSNSNLQPPPPNQRFIFDPTHAELTGEYQYPVGYTIIPLVLPNMTGVVQAESVLVQMAAQSAAH